MHIFQALLCFKGKFTLNAIQIAHYADLVLEINYRRPTAGGS